MKTVAAVFDNKLCFKEMQIEERTLGDFDLKVSVKAISLNPVDYKVANGVNKDKPGPRILGWDASGVVLEVGSKVKNFKIGDEVYYAGDITKEGSNAEKQIIDSRIVAKKPHSLSHKEAAALPLTAITAWEGMFEGLQLVPNKTTKEQTLLVIGGAGGVGSMVIQLAKKLTNLKVVATSSREDSSAWAKKMGADEVIDYREGLKKGASAIGGKEFDYIYCTNNTDQYFKEFAEVIKPFGKIVSIVEPNSPVDIGLLKSKSAVFAWEFMFTKSMYQTPDMHKQGELLSEVAKLVDEKKIVTTMNVDLGVLSATSLEKGHELLKSGKTIGKIVLSGL